MAIREVLLATCWTTAGDALPLPGKDLSPLSLRERIEAAGEAGFRGFGLLDCDLDKFLLNNSLQELKKILEDNGVEAIELEFLTGWFTTGDEKKASNILKQKLFTAAEALGAHHIKIATDITGGAWEKDHWAKELLKLGKEVESYGTKLAIEFMPFANVKNLATGLDLVNTVDHLNVGLMVDMWHIARGGTSLDELAKVPLHRIIGVELDDADAVQIDDGYSDTINRRRLCGEGDLPVVGMIQTLKKIGWTGPWGVEILSVEHRSLELHEAARRAFNTTAECFRIANAG
jgi:sugar phosphate isomerase/epimerase